VQVTDDLLSIGEVSDRSGLTHSALRYYESEGLVRAHRSAGGQRRYERDVLRRLAFIRIAQRVGLTLDEVRTALGSLPDERTPTAKDWAQLSRSWRPRLDEQITMLVRLREELSSCIGCGCLSLRACTLYNPADGASAFGPGPRYLLGDTAADVIGT
jgi:MerR family transcriptional regulator, redox-sensitive transcriptional activator SoxR